MKAFQKFKDKLHFLTHFTYEESYREQLELGAITKNYRSERIITYVMLVMQIFMFLVFVLRPGNIFQSTRRLYYAITYAVLLLFLLVFLPVHKRSKENYRLHTRLCTAFGVLMSLWIISISYLDSLEKTGIVVYCSIMPIMAVFLVMPPHILSILFLLTYILTNSLVLSTPYGQENVFSTLINSTFILVLSIIYAWHTYHSRLTGVYDEIHIAQKNKELEAVNQELELLSITDALTALGNRRYLETEVKPTLEKYGMYMGPLTVLLLDIDRFKQYNDHYGHQQGDVYLQAVASVLSDFTQKNDFRAVRYGGDEFILVMTGVSKASILEKAEELCQSISSLSMQDIHGNEISITISVGVAFYPSWEPDFLEYCLSTGRQGAV